MALITLMFGSFMQGMAAKAASSGWLTFHDPVYGYTLQYPASWLLTPEKDGSHISLENPATGTTMNPDIAVRTQAPDFTAPAGAINAHTWKIAGYQAFDYVIPYVSGQDHAHGGGQEQYRQVIFSLKNTAGTYNVYTWFFISPTDATGQVSAGAQNDNATFERILNSLILPTSKAPAIDPRNAKSPHIICQVMTPACGGSGCDAVCWAEANWDYNAIDDGLTDGRDCPTAYNNCIPEQYAHTGYYQPDFQCANFVSRALTEEGLIPGMANGGVSGSSTVTGITGNYSYGSYPFTYYANAGSGTHNYDLVWVGTRGSTGTGGNEPPIDGLFEYLLDSGIGVNIGENVSAASPGDPIFFEDSPQPGPDLRKHVMLITAVMNDSWKSSYNTGGWDAYLDGHNIALHHVLLQSQMGGTDGFASFEIIHIRTSWVTNNAIPALTGPQQWVPGTDSLGQPMDYVPTTNQWGSATNWAKWDSYGAYNCAVIVYVPATSYASANPARFEVETSDNVWHQTNFDENTVYGMVMLYKWGDLSSAYPIAVYVPNEDGSTTHYLGVSNFFYVC